MRFPIQAPRNSDPNERYIFDAGVVENFKACFAVGDNFIQIVDTGSTDYTQIIDAAIGKLTSGGTLYFPVGTFTATSITVDQEIRIEGPGTIQQKASSAVAYTPFINVTADNVWFDGVTIDGNKANQGTVTDAYLLKFSNGADNCKVTNCRIINSTGDCIRANSADNLEIVGNYFSNWWSQNVGAITVYNQDGNATLTGLRIRNNYIDGATSDSGGIKIAANSTYPAYNIIISGNHVLAGSSASYDTLGIELYSTDSTVGFYGVTIDSNVVVADNDTNTRLWGISATYSNSITISGNSVYNCNHVGIEAPGGLNVSVVGNSCTTNGSGDYGILIGRSSQVTVNGNTSIGFLNGIYIAAWETAVSCLNIIVSNNLIYPDDGANPSNASGVSVVTANNAGNIVRRVLIVGNMVVGNNTDYQYGVVVGMYDSGTISDVFITGNFLYNLSYGVYRSSETNTIITNNYDLSVDTLLTGTAGSGENSSLQVWNAGGIGNGAAGNVQAPAKGTGSGPTTAGTVVKFIPIDVAGTTYYIPLMQ
jgi:hypothetical protein